MEVLKIIERCQMNYSRLVPKFGCKVVYDLPVKGYYSYGSKKPYFRVGDSLVLPKLTLFAEMLSNNEEDNFIDNLTPATIKKDIPP
jgi:hypothetical protein